MRKAFHLCLGFLLVVFLVSCGKEQSVEIGNNPPAALSGSLKMKINGTQWTADQAVGASVIAGLVNITGKSKDGKTLTITLTDTITGTYVINQNAVGVAVLQDSLDVNSLSYTSNQGADSIESGGTVTITSIDKVNKTISGTFKVKLFRAFDSKQKLITEGVIDKVAYTSLLAPSNTTDTLNVKIDTTVWSGKSITGLTLGGSIIINASDLDVSKTVGLKMPSNIVAGTYNLETFGDYSAQYNPNLTSFLVSQSGKLTIIEHNKVTKRIRGNFEFKAMDLVEPVSAQLTAGYFSVVYR